MNPKHLPRFGGWLNLYDETIPGYCFLLGYESKRSNPTPFLLTKVLDLPGFGKDLVSLGKVPNDHSVDTHIRNASCSETCEILHHELHLGFDLGARGITMYGGRASCRQIRGEGNP